MHVRLVRARMARAVNVGRPFGVHVKTAGRAVYVTRTLTNATHRITALMAGVAQTLLVSFQTFVLSRTYTLDKNKRNLILRERYQNNKNVPDD